VERILLDPVVRHQQPPRQALFDGVHRVAGGRLHHAADERLREPGRELVERSAAIRLRPVCGDAHSEAGIDMCLHHRHVRRRCRVEHGGRADDALAAHRGNFDQPSIFEHRQYGTEPASGKVQVLDHLAGLVQNFLDGGGNDLEGLSNARVVLSRQKREKTVGVVSRSERSGRTWHRWPTPISSRTGGRLSRTRRNFYVRNPTDRAAIPCQKLDIWRATYVTDRTDGGGEFFYLFLADRGRTVMDRGSVAASHLSSLSQPQLGVRIPTPGPAAAPSYEILLVGEESSASSHARVLRASYRVATTINTDVAVQYITKSAPTLVVIEADAVGDGAKQICLTAKSASVPPTTLV